MIATVSSMGRACRTWSSRPAIVSALNSEFRIASSVASIAAWNSRLMAGAAG
jgi:hypothetical protein